MRMLTVVMIVAGLQVGSGRATETLAASGQGASRYVLASVADDAGQPVVGLSHEDFVIQEGDERCETLAASPARYPIAILVDTSEAARAEFTPLRSAIRQFIDRLSGHDVALYTFGDRALKVVDFTADLGKLQRAADQLFAQPEGESHVLDAIIEAGKAIAKREPAVAMIVVVSAGSNDQSSRTPREVLEPTLASRAMLQVVEMRSPQASGRLNNPRLQRNFTSDKKAEAAGTLEELLRALAERTRGHYEQIYSSSGYHARLGALRGQIASELVIEYLGRPQSPPAALKIGAHLPGATVTAIALDRRPQ
jgi:hypothetical protein